MSPLGHWRTATGCACGWVNPGTRAPSRRHHYRLHLAAVKKTRNDESRKEERSG